MVNPSDETGYHRYERWRINRDLFWGYVVAGPLIVWAVVMIILNPIGAFFEYLFWERSNEDDDELPDYSMAERIPDQSEPQADWQTREE